MAAVPFVSHEQRKSRWSRRERWRAEREHWKGGVCMALGTREPPAGFPSAGLVGLLAEVPSTKTPNAVLCVSFVFLKPTSSFQEHRYLITCCCYTSVMGLPAVFESIFLSRKMRGLCQQDLLLKGVCACVRVCACVCLCTRASRPACSLALFPTCRRRSPPLMPAGAKRGWSPGNP